MKLAFPSTLRFVMVALLFGGCGSGDSEQPDLVPSSVRTLPCGGCAPLVLEVCVDNLGAGEASGFDVTVNELDRADVTGLAAGQEACVEIEYTFAHDGPANAGPFVQVDSLDQVQESDESNNILMFPQPSGTECDLICTRSPARPVATPPPPAPI